MSFASYNPGGYPPKAVENILPNHLPLITGIVQTLPLDACASTVGLSLELLYEQGPKINDPDISWAMAIGYFSNISGKSPYSYSIGNSAKVNGSAHSFAIGNNINISSPYSFAFGNYADIDSKSQFSFAIGGTATSNSNGGDVNYFCYPTINNSKWSYNFGSGKIQDSNSAIWLGHQTDNTDTNLSNDQWNIYNSTESIGLGSYHTISGGRTNIALGYEQHIKESSYSTGIGYNNVISDSTNGVVIGYINTLHSNGSIIVGISNNIHNGKYSTAIGYNNTVSGNNSIAVGSNTNIITDNTFGINGNIYAGDSFYFKEVSGISMPTYSYLDDISNTQVYINGINCIVYGDTCPILSSANKSCCNAKCHSEFGKIGPTGTCSGESTKKNDVYNLSLQPPNSSEVKYSDSNIIQETSSINLTNVVCALVGAVKELNQIVQGLSSEINTNIHNIHKDISSISGDVHDIQHYLTGNGNITQINSETPNPKNIYLGISGDLSSANTLKDWNTLQRMSQWRQFL